jgi:hypothetical protein
MDAKLNGTPLAYMDIISALKPTYRFGVDMRRLFFARPIMWLTLLTAALVVSTVYSVHKTKTLEARMDAYCEAIYVAYKIEDKTGRAWNLDRALVELMSLELERAGVDEDPDFYCDL